MPFDRVVIATGADYRFGLGPFAKGLLALGAGHWPGLAQLMSNEALRQWFYYRARRGTADRFRRFVRSDQKLMVVGDALRAGKSKEAIASAFEAALLGASTAAGIPERPATLP